MKCLGRKYWAVCSIASLLMVLSVSAYACSCDEPTDTKSAVRSADIVFSGTVKSIGEQPSKLELYGSFPFIRYSDTSNAGRVTFAVKEVWKGDLAADINIVDSIVCGYGFKEGDDYLVYANMTSEYGFVTGMCRRNRLLSAAKRDVAELGSGRLPVGAKLLTFSATVLALVVILALGSFLVWWVAIRKSSDLDREKT